MRNTPPRKKTLPRSRYSARCPRARSDSKTRSSAVKAHKRDDPREKKGHKSTYTSPPPTTSNTEVARKIEQAPDRVRNPRTATQTRRKRPNPQERNLQSRVAPIPLSSPQQKLSSPHASEQKRSRRWPAQATKLPRPPGRRATRNPQQSKQIRTRKTASRPAPPVTPVTEFASV